MRGIPRLGTFPVGTGTGCLPDGLFGPRGAIRPRYLGLAGSPARRVGYPPRHSQHPFGRGRQCRLTDDHPQGERIGISGNHRPVRQLVDQRPRRGMDRYSGRRKTPRRPAGGPGTPFGCEKERTGPNLRPVPGTHPGRQPQPVVRRPHPGQETTPHPYQYGRSGPHRGRIFRLFPGKCQYRKPGRSARHLHIQHRTTHPGARTGGNNRSLPGGAMERHPLARAPSGKPRLEKSLGYPGRRSSGARQPDTPGAF